MTTKNWFQAHLWTTSYIALIVTLELILMLVLVFR